MPQLLDDNLSFDHIKKLLFQRNKHSQCNSRIVYLDENEEGKGSSLNRFIFDTLVKVKIEKSLRLGILYKYQTHTTPIVIEVIDNFYQDETDNANETESDVEESEEEESEASFSRHSTAETAPPDEPVDLTIAGNPYRFIIRIFNTDSRSFDIASGEGVLLRINLVNLVQKAFERGIHLELFATGLVVNEYIEKVSTIRQHTEGHCSVFSMLDLETMLSVDDLVKFFGEANYRMATPHEFPDQNSTIKQDCFGRTQLYHIKKLPDELMLYTQSINGCSEDGMERRGLKHFVRDTKPSHLHEIAISNPQQYTPNQASSSPSPISDQAHKLWSFIQENTNESGTSFNIQTLLSYLIDHQIKRNFIFDALAFVYSAKIPISSPDACANLNLFSVEKLENLMNESPALEYTVARTTPIKEFLLIYNQVTGTQLITPANTPIATPMAPSRSPSYDENSPCKGERRPSFFQLPPNWEFVKAETADLGASIVTAPSTKFELAEDDVEASISSP